MYQELTQPFFTEYVESFVEVPQTDENFSVYLGCTKSDSLLHIYFEDQLFFPALWDLGGFIECDLRVWHTLPEPAKWDWKTAYSCNADVVLHNTPRSIPPFYNNFDFFY